MRIVGIVGTGAAVICLSLAGLIAYGSWVNAHMMYPRPANESAFLRSYNPRSLVQQFIYTRESYSEGDGSGGGAGTKFVKHNSHFDEFFTMRADQRCLLTMAVNDDASQRIVRSGARILSQSGTCPAGFHVQYATGNTIGSVAISPVSVRTIERNVPLPDGFEDVSMKIEVREQWFPNGIPPGLVQLLPESDR